MDSDSIARLIYLALLGTVIGGWFLLQNRNSLGKSAQHAAVWGLIFIGVIATVGLWGDIRDDVLPHRSFVNGADTVEVPRARDGQYYLTLDIDGTDVRFVIDTGASDVVLRKEDARRIGIDPDSLNYFGIALTANGEVRTAQVRLKNVRLGEIIDLSLRATVNDGELDTSLLGMSYLQRFEKIEIGRGKMILRR